MIKSFRINWEVKITDLIMVSKIDFQYYPEKKSSNYDS